MSSSGVATLPYSVVVPVYRNAQTLPDVVQALEGLQDRLGVRVEGVFVVDGSPDNSAEILQTLLPESAIESQLVIHARNFGAFAAIRTGFLAARGRYVAAMAADLQEPISLVEEFYRRLSSGDYDVAVGARVSRQDPGLSKVLSNTYWAVYRRMVMPDMPAGGVDIFACTAQVAQDFARLNESNSSLVGLLYWLGYRRVEVPYERVARRHGTSSWSMKKKVKYLLDSVFSFTSLPISIILFIGTLGSITAFLTAIVVFFAWLTGSIQVPGYTATMLVTLTSTAAIFLALGIVGTYVWRAFENTKQRPVAVVARSATFPAASHGDAQPTGESAS